MRDYGYSDGSIGLLWAFAVFAEVIIFIFMPLLLTRFGSVVLFASSFLFSALRWCLIAYWPHQLPLIVFAQALHAVTFGVYHAAAIALIDRWFPSGFQVRGHSLYSGTSFGIGGALGVLMAGWLWSEGSGAHVFLISAAISLLGFVLAVSLCYLAAGHQQPKFLGRRPPR